MEMFYAIILVLLVLGAISSVAFLSDRYESKDNEL
jgi:hypothetical protein